MVGGGGGRRWGLWCFYIWLQERAEIRKKKKKKTS